MVRTKCDKCSKQFLLYELGDLCPSCGERWGGRLRKGWSRGSTPQRAPLVDSEFFAQRSSTKYCDAAR